MVDLLISVMIVAWMICALALALSRQAASDKNHDFSALFRHDRGVLNSRPSISYSNPSSYHHEDGTCSSRIPSMLDSSVYQAKPHRSTRRRDDLSLFDLMNRHEIENMLFSMDDVAMETRFLHEGNIKLTGTDDDSSNSIIIEVDNINDDFVPNSLYCTSTSVSPGHCNLRSAWLACMATTNPCKINLPESSVVYSNKTYAALTMQSTSHVEIIGRNTTITSVGVLLNGHVEKVNNASFPYFAPDLTNTNFDEQNYVTTCLTGCPGQQLNFSTCYPQSVGDTYIRLYQGPVEVSSNDDYCGRKSQIIYDVPLSGACRQYCIRLGCYSSDTCSVYVTATISPSTSPQFISYAQGSATGIPSLTIKNVTVEGFGTSSNNGGAFSIVGNINFQLSNALILLNTASVGGAIYLADNNIYSGFEYVTFAYNDNFYVEDGVGVYFDGNTTNVLMNHIIVADAIAFRGGAHQNIIINHATMYGYSISLGGSFVRNVTISNVDSYSTGFSFLSLVQQAMSVKIENIWIHPYPWSLYDDDYYTGQDLNTSYSSFFPEENIIYIGTSSSNIYMNNVTVFCNSMYDDDTSEHTDANIITVKSASYVYMTGISIKQCELAQTSVGGMMAIVNSKYISLDQVLIEEVSSLLMGGGIFFQYTQYVTIQNSVFQSCHTSDSGGAIAIYNGNSQVQIINTVIMGSTASKYGGGVFLGDSNNYVTIAGCNITNNGAKDSGGGIFVTQSNYHFSVMDLLALQNFVTVQSDHPYVVENTYQGATTAETSSIYATTIAVEGVTGYLLSFDSATQFQNGFCISITAIMTNTVLLYSCSSDLLPGISAPSLYLPCENDYLSFFFFAVGEKVPVTTGLYGVKAYFYPVFPTSTTQPTMLTGNHAKKGGGMLLYYANQFSVILNTMVYNNSASNGGGVVYQNGNVGGALQQVNFTGNFASSNGGGMVIQSGQFGMTFRDCTFYKNTAESNGAAVYLGSSNGVGVLVSGNAIQFTTVDFNSNLAWMAGGAIYTSDDDTLYIANSTFTLNYVYSGDGGAIYLGQSCYANFTSGTMFLNNLAFYRGGAIFSNQENVITLSNTCRFIGNLVFYAGGGLALFNDTVLALLNGNVEFNYNEAYTVGAAIAISAAPLWITLKSNNHITFFNNTAPRGSAVFIYDMTNWVGSVYMPNHIVNTSFLSNTAYVGGTVFWVYDAASMYTEPGIRDPSNVWNGNIAGYGNISATQAISLLSPPEYNVTVYGAYLTPSINITLWDYYHQQVAVTGETSISVAIDGNKFNCTSYPFLSGPDLFNNGVPMNYSVARFEELQVTCSPNGWVAVNFTAQLGISAYLTSSVNRVIHSYYVSNTTMLKFRGCVAGEFITKGLCQVCPLSTYNLHPNSEACKSCTTVEGVESCEGNEIVLKQGYWRRYDTSSAVQACLLDPISCTGGDSVGQMSCANGYDGPLCAVCSAGFYENNNQCIECTGSAQVTPAMIALIVIVFVAAIFALLLYRSLNKSKPKANGDEEDDDNTRQLPQSGANDEPPSTIALIYWWMREKYDDIIVRVKIVVSTFQVIASTASVFSISFPASFSSFTSGIKFFNIGFDNLIPVGCTGKYNFVSTILYTSLGPIFVSVFLLFAFVIEFLWVRYTIQKKKNRTKGMKKKAFHETKSKYLNYFFYLTYLVLPSVTTTLFQWFICTNVDPDNEDNDHYDWYLTADMSISCQSSYYRQWTIYVILMIVLYPIGIPSLYLYLLYRNKEEIMNRDKGEEESDSNLSESMSNKERPTSIAMANAVSNEDSLAREVDEEIGRRKNMSFSFANRATESSMAEEAEEEKKSELSVPAQRLSFLWQAYEPKYWYWEVIETTRKLMLTAVLSVCAPGSSEQSVLGVLMSYVYIRLYGYYRPYEEDPDDVLAETGQVQILMTFFVTLVIKNGLLSSKWNNGLGVLLTMINLGIIVLTCYYEISNYHEAVKEAREKEQKVRQLREQKRAQKRLEFALKAGGVVPSEVDNSGTTGASTIQFKKMNAKELQDLDDVKLKEKMRGKDADSDDEDGDMTTNVMHRGVNKQNKFSGDIELQSMHSPSSGKSTLTPSQQFGRKLSVEIDSDDEA